MGRVQHQRHAATLHYRTSARTKMADIGMAGAVDPGRQLPPPAAPEHTAYIE
jgi:hypothetical protein